jgi:DNA-binding transcriptional LysR family regulator
MDLNALADFNAVVAYGGFGKASRATGRPKASLSRRVVQLEQELGVRLLQRDARGLVLTEEGATLHASTTRLLGEVTEVAEAVSTHSRQPAGRLRISAPSIFAHDALGRLGAVFIARYPDVRLEVIAEDRFVDCIAEDYDIVIRANPAPDTELAGRCFLRDDLVVVAPPELAATLPVSDDEAQPVPAVMLLSASEDESWRIGRPGGERVLKPWPVARFSSISMVYDAVLAGAGAGVLPLAKVRAAVGDGRLELWGGLSDRKVEVWALYATRRQLNPKISAFVKLLVDEFEALPTDRKRDVPRSKSGSDT